MKINNLAFVLLLAVACTRPKNEIVQVAADTVASVDAKVNVLAASGADTTTIISSMLLAGTFHGDEVSEGVEDIDWFGLFTDDSAVDAGFVLRQTKIIAERVLDGLIDDEEKNEKTGWEIQTESGEYPVVLITGTNIREGKIAASGEVPGQLFPGDSVSFQFLGNRYEMFATGTAEIDSLDSRQHVAAYNLFISRTANGKTLTSLLVSHDGFDDAMTSIIWAGDLDRDNKLDLIIDRSNHYNVSAPSLFLSGRAGEREVVVFVAEHRSVGC